MSQFITSIRPFLRTLINKQLEVLSSAERNLDIKLPAFTIERAGADAQWPSVAKIIREALSEADLAKVQAVFSDSFQKVSADGLSVTVTAPPAGESSTLEQLLEACLSNLFEYYRLSDDHAKDCLSITVSNFGWLNSKSTYGTEDGRLRAFGEWNNGSEILKIRHYIAAA